MVCLIDEIWAFRHHAGRSLFPDLENLDSQVKADETAIWEIILWAPVQILGCLWISIVLNAKAQEAAVRDVITLINQRKDPPMPRLIHSTHDVEKLFQGGVE